MHKLTLLIVAMMALAAFVQCDEVETEQVNSFILLISFDLICLKNSLQTVMSK